MRKNKKILTSVLTASAILSLAFGVSSVLPKEAAAETTVLTLTDFTIDEVAQIRNSSPIGMRFGTTLSEDAKTAIAALKLTDLSYGTVMIPTDLLNGSELTKDTAQVLDIPVTTWHTEGEKYVCSLVGKSTTGEDGNVVYADLSSSYYNRAITARSYVTGKDAEGAEVTYYTANTVERSVGYIAVRGVKDGTATAKMEEIAAATNCYVVIGESFAPEYTIGEAFVYDDPATTVIGGIEMKGLATYTSSNEDVVSINGTKIEVVGYGDATVTATFAYGDAEKTTQTTISVGSPYTVDINVESTWTLNSNVTSITAENGEDISTPNADGVAVLNEDWVLAQTANSTVSLTLKTADKTYANVPVKIIKTASGNINLADFWAVNKTGNTTSSIQKATSEEAATIGRESAYKYSEWKRIKNNMSNNQLGVKFDTNYAGVVDQYRYITIDVNIPVGTPNNDINNFWFTLGTTTSESCYIGFDKDSGQDGQVIWPYLDGSEGVRVFDEYGSQTYLSLGRWFTIVIDLEKREEITGVKPTRFGVSLYDIYTKSETGVHMYIDNVRLYNERQYAETDFVNSTIIANTAFMARGNTNTITYATYAQSTKGTLNANRGGTAVWTINAGVAAWDARIGLTNTTDLIANYIANGGRYVAIDFYALNVNQFGVTVYGKNAEGTSIGKQPKFYKKNESFNQEDFPRPDGSGGRAMLVDQANGKYTTLQEEMWITVIVDLEIAKDIGEDYSAYDINLHFKQQVATTASTVYLSNMRVYDETQYAKYISKLDNLAYDVAEPYDQKLAVGGEYTITPKLHKGMITVNDTFESVTYSSDNTAIATVDENGKVTGVAAGTANITITITYNGVEYTSKFAVTVS